MCVLRLIRTKELERVLFEYELFWDYLIRIRFGGKVTSNYEFSAIENEITC